MQTLTNKLLKISPTVTLAELYESQRLYFAAYAVYWHLHQDKRAGDLQPKLDEVLMKIYAQESLKFDPALKEVFSDSQIKKLRILPESVYSDFMKEILDLESDDSFVGEIDQIDDLETEEKDKFLEIEQQIGNQWEKILNEGVRVKKKIETKGKILNSRVNWDEIRLVDFIRFLLELNLKDYTLDDLKIQELMELFLKRYEVERANETEKRKTD